MIVYIHINNQYYTFTKYIMQIINTQLLDICIILAVEHTNTVIKRYFWCWH